VAAGSDKTLIALEPQTSAACTWTSPDVQFSLKIRTLHLGTFRWTNRNVPGQNGGQTHSQSKRIGPLYRIEGFSTILGAIRQQTLCLDAVLKAHLGRDRLRASRGRWIRVVGRPRRAAQIGARMSRGSRERRMRRLRSGQLYSGWADSRRDLRPLLGVRQGHPHRAFQRTGHTGRKSRPPR
jgi:hypothetical protein